jgi:hypothetical protein
VNVERVRIGGAVEEAHERTQRVAVRDDHHVPALLQRGLQRVLPHGFHARQSVVEALDRRDVDVAVANVAHERLLQRLVGGNWRRDGCGMAAPLHHLLRAVHLGELVLVPPGHHPRVLLVEAVVLDHGHPTLVHPREHEARRAYGTTLVRGGHQVELELFALAERARVARLGDAANGKVNVHPAGEDVAQIPLRLPVPHHN